MFSECLIDDATTRDAVVDGRSWLVGWGGVVDDAEGRKRERKWVGELRFK